MSTEKALEKAGDLLLRKYRNEEGVRTDILILLEALGRNNVEPEDRAGSGHADLHCRGDYVLIEVKKTGEVGPEKPGSGTNETQKEQLVRYVQALQAEQAQRQAQPGLYDTLDTPDTSLPWRGLLTDGRVWWQYDFEDGGDDPVETGPRGFLPGEERVLCDWLDYITARNRGKPQIPAQPKDIYLARLDRLNKIYSDREERENNRPDSPQPLKTKRKLWLDMLRGSGMAPASEAKEQNLFLLHTLLMLIARAVVKVLSGSGPHTWTPDDREGFVAWVWEAAGGGVWLQGLLDITDTYDWRMETTDVLRNLYEKFIDKADRKAFGEYYTPDWLAQMLAERVLDAAWCNRAVSAVLGRGPQPGIGFLDPACGSGTFLYHAARRILAVAAPLQEEHLTDIQKADALCHLVHGLDIHPVAAEIARATLLRALPASPSAGAAALQIWQGDSLMIDRTRARDMPVFDWEEDELVLYSARNTRFVLPIDFARHRDGAQRINCLVDAACNRRPLPADLLHNQPDTYAAALQQGFKALTEIITREGNSVWAWFIRNAAAPRLLHERQVDRILANPPWVPMNDIQNRQRKMEMQLIAQERGLWTGGKRASSFDIAGLFIHRCTELYLQGTGRAAWLTNWASTVSGTWRPFRDWARAQELKVLDFSSLQPPPFHGAHSCTWLSDADLPAHTLMQMGTPIPPGAEWSNVKQSAKLRGVLPPPPQAPSDYGNTAEKRFFRRGASIFPDCLVRIDLAKDFSDQNGRCHFTTISSQKGTWKRLGPQTGMVPRAWIQPAVFSIDLLPFAVRQPTTLCIIPMQPDGTWDPDRERNRYWQKVRRHYEQIYSSGTTTPKTPERNLDHQRKLSRQFPRSQPRSQHRVLYNKSGQYLRASRTGGGGRLFQPCC